MISLGSLAVAVMATLLPPLQGAVPNPLVVTSEPVVLLDNYLTSWPSACAGQTTSSGCHETLVGIYYPDGMGPESLGYRNEPAPVFINLRGGNTNLTFPGNKAWFEENVLPDGFVGVDPNFHVVLPGEGLGPVTEGVATLIQFLRHHSEWLNIDPDRIFLFGRSFGGVLTYALTLKEDYQDLSSPDPLKHHSSRPDYSLPYSAPTDLTCLGDDVVHGELMQLFFPVSTAPGATQQQKLEDSASWWLLNPQLYGRTETPPMLLGYHLGFVNPCEEIFNPHDGTFGLLMREAIDEFVEQTNDPQLGLRSLLIDTDDLWGYEAPMDIPLAWSQAQLEPLEANLYFPPPYTDVGPIGSPQTFEVLGAAPGNGVHFFLGFTPGALSVPSCPNISFGLLDYIYLGERFADAQGKASFTLFAPVGAIGLPVFFHAADFSTCSVSNVMFKLWTQ